MQTLLVYQQPQRLKELKESTIQATTFTGNLNAPVDETMFDIEKEVDDLLPVEVKEQRVSNFLRVLEDYHATFVEAVPFRMIAMFTPNGLSVNLLWSHMDPNSRSHVPFNDHVLDSCKTIHPP
ncbi:unnamed protein product [Brassica oleracea]